MFLSWPVWVGCLSGKWLPVNVHDEVCCRVEKMCKSKSWRTSAGWPARPHPNRTYSLAALSSPGSHACHDAAGCILQAAFEGADPHGMVYQDKVMEVVTSAALVTPGVLALPEEGEGLLDLSSFREFYMHGTASSTQCIIIAQGFYTLANSEVRGRTLHIW